MSPRNSQPEQHDQGALFSDELVGNGATDPEYYEVNHRIEVVPGGVYSPERPEQTGAGSASSLLAAVQAAVVADHRHAGQVGRHSTLEREGAYADLDTRQSLVKPGDFLPGFGPVTYTNMEEAESQALLLERRRSRSKR